MYAGSVEGIWEIFRLLGFIFIFILKNLESPHFDLMTSLTSFTCASVILVGRHFLAPFQHHAPKCVGWIPCNSC